VLCCYLQSMRVEVWHRCPRSGAMAADGGGSGQREVLLGAGAVPLLDVLRKPQVGVVVVTNHCLTSSADGNALRACLVRL
jgi:hypothetical protein